jgi:photosystem II stability/assembly factor-like uncharacterized protein
VNRKTLVYMALAAAVLVAGLAATQSYSVANPTVSELAGHTHFHGLAVDPNDPSRLLLATHHGFYVVSKDGSATQVSETSDDFMGFTPHPSDPSTLFASGHPERGGNTGFVVSRDGGKTWTQLSQGAGGPVDFHQMDVSKADPNVIYGNYRGLQVSRDGGESWEMVGPGPARLIDLAASARDPDTVYAATEAGLQISMDAGQSWHPTNVTGQPVSLVEVTGDGRIFAFVVGVGLRQAEEGSPTWETLSADFGDQILLHLAADPSNADRLYAVTQKSEVLASQDGGKTWQPFGSGDAAEEG